MVVVICEEILKENHKTDLFPVKEVKATGFSFIMSQRRSKSLNVSSSEIADSIKECVRYIISREGSKIPIKRAEIIKHLTTICQTSSGQVNAVIIETNKILKQVRKSSRLLSFIAICGYIFVRSSHSTIEMSI